MLEFLDNSLSLYILCYQRLNRQNFRRKRILMTSFLFQETMIPLSKIGPEWEFIDLPSFLRGSKSLFCGNPYSSVYKKAKYS